jgi:hypothetical protein
METAAFKRGDKNYKKNHLNGHVWYPLNHSKVAVFIEVT